MTSNEIAGGETQPDTRTLYDDYLGYGVPLVLCEPRSKSLHLGDLAHPKGWPQATVDYSLPGTYQPGHHTVAMVSGHVLDVIDVDTKNGADVAATRDLAMDCGVLIVGSHETPSGGAHLFVPSTGIASRSNTERGIDFLGGCPDGSGRKLAYLPGANRPKYPGLDYRIVDPIDWIAVQNADLDAQGEAMQRFLSKAGLPQLHGEGIPLDIVFAEPLTHPIQNRLRREISDMSEVTLRDRSKRFHVLVGKCRGAGLTQGQAVTLLAPWCEQTGKFIGVVEQEVARSWSKYEQLPPLSSQPPSRRRSEHGRSAASNTQRPTKSAVPKGPQPPVQQAPALPVTTGSPTSSWGRVDLSQVLRGGGRAEKAGLLFRTDGVGLIYPGRINSLFGAIESGKSLFLHAEAARLLNSEETVCYIDFESDAESVVSRLLQLGAELQATTQNLTYLRPNEPLLPDTQAWGDFEELLEGNYSLAVVDGVTKALELFGSEGSADANERVAAWLRCVAEPLAQRTGAAVVLIDHVVKDGGNRRFPIGAQYKLAGVDGAAYRLDVVKQPILGGVGRLRLTLVKDRPGRVRPHT